MRVMMSAAGSPASISILRHLRALGHAVIGIDSSPVAESLARDFCDEFHRAPAADTEAYPTFSAGVWARWTFSCPSSTKNFSLLQVTGRA